MKTPTLETAAPQSPGSDGASEACMSTAVRRRVREILLAEFRYWNSQIDPLKGPTDAQLGAIGSVTNVMAALIGHPMPWHPQDQHSRSIQ